MKTRLNLRGLRHSLAGLAALLLLSGTASAQNESFWLGGSGDWSNAANWDVLPVSGGDTNLIFSVSPSAITNQNIASPFSLSRLTLENGSNDVTINGSGLNFVASSDPLSFPTEIFADGSEGLLRINAPVTFSVNTNLQLNRNNLPGAELVLAGPVLGSGVTVTQSLGLSPGVIGIMAHRNNTGFTGTYQINGGTILQLAAPNAVWRTWSISLQPGISSITTGTTTAAGTGYGFQDAGFNQQIGSVTGNGQLLVGTTSSTSTVLAGFANTAMSLPGPAGLAGFNIGSHFGKVGTGTLTVTNSNASLNMGVSIREGTMVLSGADGSLTNSVDITNPSAWSIYSGGQLRLNSATATTLPFGRLSDITAIRLAGGVLRHDVSNGTASAQVENLGTMRPLAGQSVVVTNMQSGTSQNVRFVFDGVNAADLARGGQVAFVGPALGGTPGAGVSNIQFDTAPTTVNGIIPWAVSQDNYAFGGHTVAANTFAFNTLAILGPNGVAPLTTFVDNTLGGATDNVRLNAPAVTPGASAANSLTIDVGGGATLGGALNLTSGAIFNRAALANISGGSVTTAGRMYVNSGVGAVLDMASGVNAQGISKGGAGTVNLLGPVTVPAGAIISANAGTLNMGPGAPLNAIYQVAGGATMGNLPAGITGTVRGSGTVVGALAMGPGSLLGATSLAGDLVTGAAPGVLTVNGTLSMAGTSRLRFYLSSVFDGPHTQGRINTTGLDLTGASSTNQIIVQPHSLFLSNDGTGDVYDFDAFESYTWTMVSSTSPIVGFESNKFAIDLANFTNNLPAGSQFVVEMSGNNLNLTFIPIPEPALLGVAAFGLLAIARRRKA